MWDPYSYCIQNQIPGCVSSPAKKDRETNCFSTTLFNTEHFWSATHVSYALDHNSSAFKYQRLSVHSPWSSSRPNPFPKSQRKYLWELMISLWKAAQVATSENKPHILRLAAWPPLYRVFQPPQHLSVHQQDVCLKHRDSVSTAVFAESLWAGATRRKHARLSSIIVT